MHAKNISKPAFFAVLATMAYAPSANAQITGTLDSTITLENGCIINGDLYPDTGSAGLLALISFGTHPTLFTQAEGDTATNSIEIQCSPNITPTLSFDAGAHTAQGSPSVRAMKHSSATQFISYDLFETADRNTPLPSGGTIALGSDDGTPQTLNVYARAYGRAGLTDGVYLDTVTVTITL